MQFVRSYAQVGRILGVMLLLLSILVYAVVTGYNPVIGFVLVLPVIYLVFYYWNHFLITRFFIFTLGFGAFLNLPVTTGGFPISTAIVMTGFILWFVALLFIKDPDLVITFFKRPEHLIISGFLILMMVSVKNSKTMVMSVKQMQLFIYCWLIFFFLQFSLRKREHFDKAVFWVLAAGVVVGLIGLFEVAQNMSPYQFLGNKSLLQADVGEMLLNAHPGRINGLIGDAPFHGIYMIIIACLAMYKFFTVLSPKWKRYSYGAVFLLASVNVFLTASRGALLALVIAATVMWAYLEIKGKWTIYAGVVAGGAVLLVLLVLMMPSMDLKRLYSSNSGASHSSEMRMRNVPIALKMFADYPVFGTGPEGFLANYRRYAPAYASNAYSRTVMKTHNTPLQVLVEYGITGFALMSLLYLLTMMRMLELVRYLEDKRVRYLALSLLGILSGYLFFIFTSNNLFDKNLWMVIALAQCLYTLYVCDLKKGGRMKSADAPAKKGG